MNFTSLKEFNKMNWPKHILCFRNSIINSIVAQTRSEKSLTKCFVINHRSIHNHFDIFTGQLVLFLNKKGRTLAVSWLIQRWNFSSWFVNQGSLPIESRTTSPINFTYMFFSSDTNNKMYCSIEERQKKRYTEYWIDNLKNICVLILFWQ